MNLTLTRFITANGATIGKLTGLSRPVFILEDEWKNNQQGVSCIPVGTYRALPHGWEQNSPFKFKKVWELQNVPGRIGILIHNGNTNKDTRGCLLVGLGFTVTESMSMVTRSQFALDMLQKEIGQNGFTITVANGSYS